MRLQWGYMKSAKESIKSWGQRPWNRPWTGARETIALASAISEIGLSRGMCYGPCPVNTVTLSRTGSARFVGEHFVELMGSHEAVLEVAGFELLALALAHLGYPRLAGRYEVPVTDMATTSTWIILNDEKIEAEDYGGSGPARLRHAEVLIDTAASELAWRPTSSAVPGSHLEGTPLFAGIDVDDSWRPPAARGAAPHWRQAGPRRSA